MARLKFAIRNFVGAAGVFVAAFYVAKSGISTMLIIGATAIVAGFFSFNIRDDRSGKKYGPYMLLYGGLLVLAGVICLMFEKTFWILKYVGAFAVGFVGFFQWIKMETPYSRTKALRIIESFAIFVFPVLIVAGVVLSIFTAKLSLGKSLIISGAVIWAIHNIYALILMDKDGKPDSSKFKFNTKNSLNIDKNKILDEDDVINIVNMIARRWERSRDSLPHSAAVTIYVYSDVSGSRINYVVSGTLYGTLTLLDTQKYDIQCALQSKIQQIHEGLIRMTQSELSKYRQLPYDTYEIQAEIGNFDE